MKFALLILVFLSFSLNAQESCKKLTSCVGKVAKLTGKRYFYGKDLKGNVYHTKNFKLNASNADSFLSLALNINGYTRVPLPEKNSYLIISSRDVRYTPTNTYSSPKEKIPNNYDYIMMTIPLEHISSTEITRSFRPFMSRYGRILDIKAKNTLIIQDTSKNMKRLISFISILDTPLSSKQKDKIKSSREHNREIDILKAKNCSDVSKELRELRQLLEK